MFNEKSEARLERETVIWMTTVDGTGQPHTSPVWFLARADHVVVYSLAGTPRTRNIRTNPKVSLNMNSSPTGGRLAIIEGIAEIVSDGPPAHEDPEYLAKYEQAMADEGMTPETFSRDYPVRVLVRPTRLRAS